MRLRPFMVSFCMVFLALFFFIASQALKIARIFSSHSGISITQYEVANAHNTSSPGVRPQVIPKMIHQIFHDWQDQSMPADWEDLRRTCIRLNQDWEYILCRKLSNCTQFTALEGTMVVTHLSAFATWCLLDCRQAPSNMVGQAKLSFLSLAGTETTSREFLEAHFHWFLPTYDSYRYPVQRVDAFRYFLMRHFGGIYIDLDNGCAENLTPLLNYPTFVTDGGHGALSNNILGATPNHHFWILLTDSLISYNYDYLFPYVTISYASGQWFETAIWEAYHTALTHEEDKKDREGSLYRIMMDTRPGADSWVYFTSGRGESWVNWDNAVFKWIGSHLASFVLMLASSALMVWWLICKVCCEGKKTSRAYEKLEIA